MNGTTVHMDNSLTLKFMEYYNRSILLCKGFIQDGFYYTQISTTYN
jgi:hypothetical protein